MGYEKKFACDECGDEKIAQATRPGSTIFQVPNCCGKQMYVAS
jgi:predicted RNA-binding Zn-ribbon protein involved in translation (DUF1610 family)